MGERKQAVNQGCCHRGRLQIHEGRWEVGLACGFWSCVVVAGAMCLGTLAAGFAHQEGIGQVESSILHVTPHGTSP